MGAIHQEVREGTRPGSTKERVALEVHERTHFLFASTPSELTVEAPVNLYVTIRRGVEADLDVRSRLSDHKAALIGFQRKRSKSAFLRHPRIFQGSTRESEKDHIWHLRGTVTRASGVSHPMRLHCKAISMLFIPLKPAVLAVKIYIFVGEIWILAVKYEKYFCFGFDDFFFHVFLWWSKQDEAANLHKTRASYYLPNMTISFATPSYIRK